MRIAYLDCFAGAAGDMILGALVDAGWPVEELGAVVRALRLAGVEVQAERSTSRGIAGTRIGFVLPEQHVERHLADVRAIIEASALSPSIKERSVAVFSRLAEAEAKVHGTAVEHVHFHEVGGLDAILDVVGGVAGLDALGVERLFVSALNVGGGTVRTEHGWLPVPAPATLELLRDVPIYAGHREGECLTPTAAAMLATLASEFGSLPPLRVSAIGHGLGTRTFSFPNVLRLLVGEFEGAVEEDSAVMVETNVDDMNPEIEAYVTERLLARGALDVTLTPTIMKKGRPAVIISVLAPPHLTDEVVETLLRETSSIGVRLHDVRRRKLERREERVETPYGSIRVKVAWHGDVVANLAPEYEDCRAAALAADLPLKQIYEEALRAAHQRLGRPSPHEE